MNERFTNVLRQLRLSGMIKTLDIRLQEAAGNQLSHAEFLELILRDEMAVRNSRLVERRVKAAGFRDQKNLEEKSHLVQAIGHQVIRVGFTVLYRSIFDVVRDFLGDEALAQTDRTLNKYLKPDLLIIDDMGMKQSPKRSGGKTGEVQTGSGQGLQTGAEGIEMASIGGLIRAFLGGLI